jgi:hypothetical protein
MRAHRLVFLGTILLLCSLTAVASEPIERLDLAQTSARKVALVIGNARYQRGGLANPGKDADLIARSLRPLGFEVTEKQDLTTQLMAAAFHQFAEHIRPGDIVLIYYAGHGVQIGGKNFLIPIDYVPQTLTSFVDIGEAMNEIASKSGLNIIILDACRNNYPISNLPDEGAGFTEFKNTPGGTFVAFSTSPGNPAADGPGENSPYATALAGSLMMRPARLEDVFINTQIQVERATAEEVRAGSRLLVQKPRPGVTVYKQQVPWTSSSLKRIYYFAEDGVANLPAPRPEFLGSLHTQLLGGLLGGLRPFSFSTPQLDDAGVPAGTPTPRQAKAFTEPLGGASLNLVEIPAGRFLMGAGATELEVAVREARLQAEDGLVDDAEYEVLAAELPQHAVNVKGFYLSRTEITQVQYQAIMGNLPDIDPGQRGPQLPVLNVTWQEANEFCARL